MSHSFEILQIVTKPVVDPPFLRDWLSFLSNDQQFKVHLFYAGEAFPDSDAFLQKSFGKVRLHRIESLTRHGAVDQCLVSMSNVLDMNYLSKSLNPALVHSHDSRSLVMSRYFFPSSSRLHSWWLEDRSAHRLWRVLLERLATWRTWETADNEPENTDGPLAALRQKQIPLPTPYSPSGEYTRGKAFTILRELYRDILRDLDLRQNP